MKMNSGLLARSGKSVEFLSSNEYHERWIVEVGFNDLFRLHLLFGATGVMFLRQVKAK